jgi:hypothetical protein
MHALQIRKAKLIASYELHIKVNWQGTTADGQQGSGLIELPYVADENHEEDPEIKVLLPNEDAASQQLKAEILTKGKEVRHTWVWCGGFNNSSSSSSSSRSRSITMGMQAPWQLWQQAAAATSVFGNRDGNTKCERSCARLLLTASLGTYCFPCFCFTRCVLFLLHAAHLPSHTHICS